MEQNFKEQIMTSSSNINPNFNLASNVCLVCHQPILPQYYFCPNCGAKINSAPLSTTIGTQAWIYAFSIILPMILFIFVTRWPGVKYYKSNDKKAKQIGRIAWALLILSTILTIWLTIILTNEMIQSSINSINTDFGSF